MPPLSLLLNLLMGVGIPAAMTLPGIIGSYPERESLKMAKEDKQKQSILMGQMLARERARDAYQAGEDYTDKIAARADRSLDRSAMNQAALLQLIGQLYGQPSGANQVDAMGQMGERGIDSMNADLVALNAQQPTTIWDRILG